SSYLKGLKTQLVGLFVFLSPLLGLSQEPSRSDLGFFGGLVLNHMETGRLIQIHTTGFQI
ncbi:hypothetical protein OAK35_02840, partial [Crocinitomicaceae bacterium]|nr:hypothetical protein [Crocinitomicaceae bacterium]